MVLLIKLNKQAELLRVPAPSYLISLRKHYLYCACLGKLQGSGSRESPFCMWSTCVGVDVLQSLSGKTKPMTEGELLAMRKALGVNTFGAFVDRYTATCQGGVMPQLI